jgi:hypothetical protein
MVHDKFDEDEPANQARQEWEARLKRETKVGWPTIAATGAVAAFGILLAIYLTLDACVGR